MNKYGQLTRLVRALLAFVLCAGVVFSAAAQQTKPAPGEAKPLTIDQRLARLERLMANQKLVELFMRLESLQKEVEALRGEVEMQTHAVDGLKKRQKDLYLDVDARLQQVETATKAVMMQSNALPSANMDAPLTPGDSAPPVGGIGAEGMVPAGESPQAPTDMVAGDAEADVYQRAFNTLKDGDYQRAIIAFSAFLQQFPSGTYADNAQYWLGEAHYVTRDFRSAVQEFDKVLSRYPDSAKVADAQLKIGFSYYELGEWKLARKALEAVGAKYAKTTAARLAEKRLQQMKLEGKF